MHHATNVRSAPYTALPARQQRARNRRRRLSSPWLPTRAPSRAAARSCPTCAVARSPGVLARPFIARLLPLLRSPSITRSVYAALAAVRARLAGTGLDVWGRTRRARPVRCRPPPVRQLHHFPAPLTDDCSLFPLRYYVVIRHLPDDSQHQSDFHTPQASLSLPGDLYPIVASRCHLSAAPESCDRDPGIRRARPRRIEIHRQPQASMARHISGLDLLYDFRTYLVLSVKAGHHRRPPQPIWTRAGRLTGYPPVACFLLAADKVFRGRSGMLSRAGRAPSHTAEQR